jgi:histidine triad (HIT) family protein
MPECVFCKIISGKNPGQVLYHDEQISAIRDIHPAAPIHILIVPNKHIASLNELESEDEGLICHMFIVARQIAQQEGIDRSGYRLVINTGGNAGQVVMHLHLHLLGGQHMRYRIG